jgi:hypothetical protein
MQRDKELNALANRRDSVSPCIGCQVPFRDCQAVSSNLRGEVGASPRFNVDGDCGSFGTREMERLRLEWQQCCKA